MLRRKLPTATPAQWGLSDTGKRAARRDASYVLAIAVATVVAWQFAIGTLVLFPFSLLATWFHEMGHGLAAMAFGADFQRLVIFADASGFAEYVPPAGMSGVSRAAIAATGLMGPALAGSLLIAGSRSRRATRMLLTGLGLALIASTFIWVRSLAGWLVLPGFAGLALWAGLRAKERARRFVIELFGVQAAISVWQDLGYLFSSGGTVGGVAARSDSAVIADALLLPYWFWGGAITLAILAMVWSAFRFAGGKSRARARR